MTILMTPIGMHAEGFFQVWGLSCILSLRQRSEHHRKIGQRHWVVACR